MGSTNITNLSYFWAKKSRNSFAYLPITAHLFDTRAAALYLWRNALPVGTVDFLCEQTDGNAEALIEFLALVHDIGKASPAFQAKKCYFEDLDDYLSEGLFASGYKFDSLTDAAVRNCPHNLVGQALLEDYGVHASVSCIVGGHHGLYAESPKAAVYPAAFGKTEEWRQAQRFIFDSAAEESGFCASWKIPKAAQVILTAILITADWLASSEEIFPLIAPGEEIDRAAREENGIAIIGERFPGAFAEWNGAYGEDLYRERFGFAPRDFQITAAQTAKSISKPGIMIIEAPMGCGKTEAALVAAEIFAENADRGGFYFALPTQATSNGIFPRILDYLKKLGGGSLELCHGKAQFNEEYRKLYKTASGNDYDQNGGVVADSWFDGRKKSLLADFAVGTVDRVLMIALKQKHVVLGHLGLLNKVVIIDECHAYDAYMSEYLKQTLQFLGGYDVPVIILSATLPAAKRAELISAYTNKPFVTDCTAYPLMTYTDCGSVFEQSFENLSSQAFAMDSQRIFSHNKADDDGKPLWLNEESNAVMRKTDAKRRANKLVKTCSEDKQPQKTVYLSCKDTDGITELLREKLVCGGAAAVIVNTVKRAQRIAEALRQVFGADVFLLHSRFADSGRIKREQYLMDKIGKHASLKPDERFIVVGTQVIEQSLDIDFDFMITDICPIDLLLQRMGRLHRHNRSRRALLEKPQCAVLTDDEAYEKSAYVYAEYLLRKTGALLDEYKTVDLPRDIPIMVNAVYSDEEDSTDFADLRQEWLQKIAEKQGKAHAFLLGELKDSRFDARNNLKHWLDFSQSNSDAAGEASVRDGGRSLEIILIREQPEGYYTVGGAFLSGKGEPTEETCRIAARESLRLPQSLSNGKTLEELERRTLSQFSRWLASPWLAGQLILALPPEGAELSGFHIDYNTETGFTYERNHSTGV